MQYVQTPIDQNQTTEPTFNVDERYLKQFIKMLEYKLRSKIVSARAHQIQHRLANTR